MRSASFVRLLLASSAYITHASAENCCWSDYWAENNRLWLTWDEPAGAVKCGLAGPLYPGTRCSVEHAKDVDGNTQALANVVFGDGENANTFKFLIAFDPHNCDTLPEDQFVTGWVGWGSFLFKKHRFKKEKMHRCTDVQDHLGLGENVAGNASDA